MSIRSTSTATGDQGLPSAPMWARRLGGEFVGTTFLAASVVGSGAAAEALTDDLGLRLLINAFATAAGLAALIVVLGPVSGAHFNPVVTLINRALGGITSTIAAGYVVAQVIGAACGAVLANLMFSEPAISLSRQTRAGTGLWLGEIVATTGLVLVVFGLARSRRAELAALGVASYIAAAYFFTSSTSFANPALTLGRTLTETFSGIAPRSAPAFVASQLAGGVIGLLCVVLLFPLVREDADRVVVPHDR